MSENLAQKSHFLVYQAEDGMLKIDVRLEDETVWLTQQLIADLFQTTVPNISIHIRNVFEEGELTAEATVKKFLTVRQEGSRQVQRELEYYNLDMIISVGYRVKSHVATRFRQEDQEPSDFDCTIIDKGEELRKIAGPKERRKKP